MKTNGNDSFWSIQVVLILAAILFNGCCQQETDKDRLMALCDQKYDLGHCETACNQGVAAACNIMGQQYEWGVKEIADAGRSLGFYQRACHLGHEVACCQAAMTLSGKRVIPGGAVPANKNAARYYAKRSCDLGHPVCCGLFKEERSDYEPGTQHLLPDGAYLVLGSAASVDDLEPGEDQRVVEFAREFAQREESEPPEYLLVRNQPDVTLDLADSPTSGKDAEGKAFVRLSLAPDAALRLEMFTESQVEKGSSVAMIIGGRVVTKHKIRAKIGGGQLQISCCAKGACEFLIKNLEDNL